MLEPILNPTNRIWQLKLAECVTDYDFIVKPRGMEVKEIVNGGYSVPMPAYLNLKDRKVNLPFMLGEAAWIVSGSNALDQITPYMKGYARYSDDGVFMRGAYGPKVVDQLPYIIEALEKDHDSRQALLTTWRERPGPSKDVPCTVSMQFMIREKKLHMIVTMRSNDIVMGFTYDVFTFSMVAKAVQLLLLERGLNVGLGYLHVNAGSLHLYSDQYDNAESWQDSLEVDESISEWVEQIDDFNTYAELCKGLQDLAHDAKFYRDRYNER